MARAFIKFFVRCFKMHIFFLASFVLASTPAQAMVQHKTSVPFVALLNRLVLLGNLPALKKLSQIQGARSERCAKPLTEEVSYDVLIVQSAHNMVEKSFALRDDAAREAQRAFNAHCIRQHILQDKKNDAHKALLSSLQGCERIAFVNVMLNDTLTVSELEKTRLLYEQQEDSQKYQPMADCLALKIQRKKLEAQLKTQREAFQVLLNMEQREQVAYHPVMREKEAEQYLLERDLERVQAQLEFLYKECAK